MAYPYLLARKEIVKLILKVWLVFHVGLRKSDKFMKVLVKSSVFKYVNIQSTINTTLFLHLTRLSTGPWVIILFSTP